MSVLHELEQRIAERAQASAEQSYTRQLLDKGAGHCAKKLGEEAVELVIAALGEDRARVASECADLFYHALVLLRCRGVSLADVEAALAARMPMSGLAEKASRAKI